MAQYNLAVLYGKGQGVGEDNREAAKWYRKAGEQGDARAQYNLAVLYFTGQGVPEDNRQAVKWFRKAARQGSARAQYNLGVLYGKGEGVLQDYVKAHAWLNLAAAQGDEGAAKLCDQIAGQMTPEQTAQAHRLAAELSRSIEAARKKPEQ